MLLILENIGLGIKSHPEMFIDKSNQIIKPWIMYVLSDTLLEPILSDLGLFKAFLEVVHQLTEIVREEKFNVSELLGRIVRSIFRYHCRKTGKCIPRDFQILSVCIFFISAGLISSNLYNCFLLLHKILIS